MRQSAVAQATSRPSGSFTCCRLAGSDPLPTVARNWSRHSPTKQEDRKRPSSRWHRNYGSGWLGISAQCRHALQHNNTAGHERRRIFWPQRVPPLRSSLIRLGITNRLFRLITGVNRWRSTGHRPSAGLACGVRCRRLPRCHPLTVPALNSSTGRACHGLRPCGVKRQAAVPNHQARSEQVHCRPGPEASAHAVTER